MSIPPEVKKFRRSLGPRIDAWEVARSALAYGVSGAEAQVRQLAQSMMVSIPSLEFPAIYDALVGVEGAAPQELAARVGKVLEAMRTEMAVPGHALHPILLFGVDIEFLKLIRHELELYGYEAVFTNTDDVALALLAERKVAFIVLQAENGLRDGCRRVALLRGTPQGTAVSIIAVMDRDTGAPVAGLSVGVGGDQCLVRPIEPKTVAKYIHARITGRSQHPESAKGEGFTLPPCTLMEKELFAANYEILREQAAAILPSAMGIISIGEQYDWSGEPDAARARQAIFSRAGTLLCSTLRWSDFIVRLDDNSFAILFPGEEVVGGCCALEKGLTLLRGRSPFAFQDKEFNLPVEAGVIAVDSASTFGEALSRVRHNLELARVQGHGRLVVPVTTKQGEYKKHVMVLADGFSGQLICQMLEKAGLNPVALDAARLDRDLPTSGLRYSMVLVDDGFSGNRGGEFLQTLRARRQFNRTPIMMLCATEEARRLAVDAGANDCLLKPYAPEVLLAGIRNNLSHGRHRETDGRTILIVDTEAPVLVAAGTVLCRNGGYRVLLARSGWEGIRRMRQSGIDSVLFCLDVKDISPEDLFRLIPQQIQAVKSLAVVLSSKTPGMVPPKTAQGMGVRGVIAKPYRLHSLVEEISTLIGVQAKQVYDSPHEHELKREIARMLDDGGSSPLKTDDGIWDKVREY